MDARELAGWEARYVMSPFGPRRQLQMLAILGSLIAGAAGQNIAASTIMPDFGEAADDVDTMVETAAAIAAGYASHGNNRNT